MRGRVTLDNRARDHGALLDGRPIDRNRDHNASVLIADLNPAAVTSYVDFALAQKLRGIIQRPHPGFFQARQRYADLIHEDVLIASNIEVVVGHGSE